MEPIVEPITIHTLVIAVAVIAALVAVEVKDILRALIGFVILSISLSIVFYMLGAPYVSVFQLAIYAGAVVVLFVTALHTMRRMKL
ncbi:NADH-quinone oxidoreductase subunit J [Candidatus Bathyarchaeota archaeon]|nr:NADH-quinone oxidoreductase subunit J [Candidatus Bathyarchaeota archaeon]MBS7612828.1 NADH-quinone oxidoreductase subunit J [Candidatus Bathyarchaeota archaeon]MBS7617162.1 NADH-quinone oxidoreductase subunit J [Candidatus Bathyarchaeota archaeon]